MASKIAVFGDSVNWGQGLLPRHKFSTLVRERLARNGTPLTVEMLAHSGPRSALAGLRRWRGSTAKCRSLVPP